MSIRQLQNSLGPAAIQYRWLIMILTLFLVAAIGSGVTRLSFTTDLRVFSSEHNPQLLALEALENVYAQDRNVLFVVAPADGNIFTRQTLAAVLELTAAGWELPFASRVDSVTNFQHSVGRADELIVGSLVPEPPALSDAELARVSAIALNEPLLVNRLISESGHVTAVNVNLLIPGEAANEVPEVAAAVRALAVQIRERYPDITLYIHGGVMMDYAFSEAAQRDMTTLAPIMFLVLIGLTGLALRSVAGTFATILVVTLAVVTGLGAAGWSGIELTTAAVGAPTIILTLAVADSMHILTIMLRAMRMGSNKSAAICETMRVNLGAVFLTSVTTALGFLSMNLSDAPPFRDLGNIVAIGVIAAFFYSVLFLPALLSLLPVKVKVDTKAKSLPFDGLAGFVIRNCRTVFWSMLLLVVALSAGILRIHLDDDWMAYFDTSYEIRQATDFLEANLTGGHVIEYSIDAGAVSGINEPGYLVKLEAFAQWYRAQEKVVHVSVLSETIKRLNKNMHDDDPAYNRLPETRDLTAQYLLLYELSLPFGLDLNNTINIDKSATRMRVLLRGTTTSQLRTLDERARAWLAEHAPPGMSTYGTGLSIIWAHLSERNIRNMLVASCGALILISLLLIFALRSLRLGLLSLIPNIVPSLVAFGVWGLLVGQVGLALSVIVSMTLGIVVDDTVHFLTKYLHGRRELGLVPARALHHAFHQVGAAMLITTVALVAGFGVLTLSSYKMTADMGLVSALTIAIALAMDFLLLPALLLRVDAGRS